MVLSRPQDSPRTAHGPLEPRDGASKHGREAGPGPTATRGGSRPNGLVRPPSERFFPLPPELDLDVFQRQHRLRDSAANNERWTALAKDFFDDCVAQSRGVSGQHGDLYHGGIGVGSYLSMRLGDTLLRRDGPSVSHKRFVQQAYETAQKAVGFSQANGLLFRSVPVSRTTRPASSASSSSSHRRHPPPAKRLRQHVSLLQSEWIGAKCLAVACLVRLGKLDQASATAQSVLTMIDASCPLPSKQQPSTPSSSSSTSAGRTRSLSNAFSSSHDVLTGRAGALQAILFLRQEMHDPTLGTSFFVNQVKHLLTVGFATARSQSSSVELVWEAPSVSNNSSNSNSRSSTFTKTAHRDKPKFFLGTVHGTAGVLQTILGMTDDEWNRLEAQLPRAKDMVRVAIDSLSTQVYQQSGNLKPTLNSTVPDRLVEWSHGAPGHCLLLLRAAQVLETHRERYIEQATELAQNVVWPRGLLTKGVGLGYGIAGNAYVFLAIANIRESYGMECASLWKKRAMYYLHYAIQQLAMLQQVPNRPHSLFGGLGGLATLCIDIQFNPASFSNSGDDIGVHFPLYFSSSFPHPCVDNNPVKKILEAVASPTIEEKRRMQRQAVEAARQERLSRQEQVMARRRELEKKKTALTISSIKQKSNRRPSPTRTGRVSNTPHQRSPSPIKSSRSSRSVTSPRGTMRQTSGPVVAARSAQKPTGSTAQEITSDSPALSSLAAMDPPAIGAAVSGVNDSSFRRSQLVGVKQRLDLSTPNKTSTLVPANRTRKAPTTSRLPRVAKLRASSQSRSRLVSKPSGDSGKHKPVNDIPDIVPKASTPTNHEPAGAAANAAASIDVRTQDSLSTGPEHPVAETSDIRDDEHGSSTIDQEEMLSIEQRQSASKHDGSETDGVSTLERNIAALDPRQASPTTVPQQSSQSDTRTDDASDQTRLLTKKPSRPKSRSPSPRYMNHTKSSTPPSDDQEPVSFVKSLRSSSSSPLRSRSSSPMSTRKTHSSHSSQILSSRSSSTQNGSSSRHASPSRSSSPCSDRGQRRVSPARRIPVDVTAAVSSSHGRHVQETTAVGSDAQARKQVLAKQKAVSVRIQREERAKRAAAERIKRKAEEDAQRAAKRVSDKKRAEERSRVIAEQKEKEKERKAALQAKRREEAAAKARAEAEAKEEKERKQAEQMAFRKEAEEVRRLAEAERKRAAQETRLTRQREEEARLKAEAEKKARKEAEARQKARMEAEEKQRQQLELERSRAEQARAEAKRQAEAEERQRQQLELERSRAEQAKAEAKRQAEAEAKARRERQEEEERQRIAEQEAERILTQAETDAAQKILHDDAGRKEEVKEEDERSHLTDDEAMLKEDDEASMQAESELAELMQHEEILFKAMCREQQNEIGASISSQNSSSDVASSTPQKPVSLGAFLESTGKTRDSHLQALDADGIPSISSVLSTTPQASVDQKDLGTPQQPKNLDTLLQSAESATEVELRRDDNKATGMTPSSEASHSPVESPVGGSSTAATVTVGIARATRTGANFELTREDLQEPSQPSPRSADVLDPDPSRKAVETKNIPSINLDKHLDDESAPGTPVRSPQKNGTEQVATSKLASCLSSASDRTIAETLKPSRATLTEVNTTSTRVSQVRRQIEEEETAAVAAAAAARAVLPAQSSLPGSVPPLSKILSSSGLNDTSKHDGSSMHMSVVTTDEEYAARREAESVALARITAEVEQAKKRIAEKEALEVQASDKQLSTASSSKTLDQVYEIPSRAAAKSALDSYQSRMRRKFDSEDISVFSGSTRDYDTLMTEDDFVPESLKGFLQAANKLMTEQLESVLCTGADHDHTYRGDKSVLISTNYSDDSVVVPTESNEESDRVSSSVSNKTTRRQERSQPTSGNVILSESCDTQPTKNVEVTPDKHTKQNITTSEARNTLASDNHKDNSNGGDFVPESLRSFIEDTDRMMDSELDGVRTLAAKSVSLHVVEDDSSLSTPQQASMRLADVDASASAEETVVPDHARRQEARAVLAGKGIMSASVAPPIPDSKPPALPVDINGATALNVKPNAIDEGAAQGDMFRSVLLEKSQDLESSQVGLRRTAPATSNDQPAFGKARDRAGSLSRSTDDIVKPDIVFTASTTATNGVDEDEDSSIRTSDVRRSTDDNYECTGNESTTVYSEEGITPTDTVETRQQDSSDSEDFVPESLRGFLAEADAAMQAHIDDVLKTAGSASSDEAGSVAAALEDENLVDLAFVSRESEDENSTRVRTNDDTSLINDIDVQADDTSVELAPRGKDTNSASNHIQPVSGLPSPSSLSPPAPSVLEDSIEVTLSADLEERTRQTAGGANTPKQSTESKGLSPSLHGTVAGGDTTAQPLKPETRGNGLSGLFNFGNKSAGGSKKGSPGFRMSRSGSAQVAPSPISISSGVNTKTKHEIVTPRLDNTTQSASSSSKKK